MLPNQAMQMKNTFQKTPVSSEILIAARLLNLYYQDCE